MAEINDDIKHLIDANKDRMFKEKQRVKRIEFGEVMYKFEEIFNTPEISRANIQNLLFLKKK